MNRDEILQVIDDAYNYCEKLYSGMDVLAINIRNRNLNDLEEYFKNILEGFSWVVEVVISLKEFYDEEINLYIVQEKIKMFIEAYNNLDLLLLSDIIEYELMIQIEQFHNILSNIKERF